MTYRAVPNYRKIKLASLTHPCPEAGGRSRTRQPTARLDRWVILRDLLVDAWSNPDEPPSETMDRHLSALSPLEADLIRRMFLNVMRIFPLPDGSEIDLEGRSISFDHEADGVSTSVYSPFIVSHPDGTSEMVRLKTGRSPSTPEEAAVMWSAAEEGESFTDLMAWPGEVEPIEPPSDLEQRLAGLIANARALHGGGVRPGPECVWCGRAALCGAYPADRVVPTSARTVNLTKTDVQGLERCHRRVAWRRVHGIPRDDGDEIGGSGVAQGRMFHSLVAVAESADAREAAVADFLSGVSPSEVADLQMMWDHHEELVSAEKIEVRRTEFPVGITLLQGERADTRGVTVLGFVDLTARMANGEPVAVEIKTGSPGDTGVEDDLYAVGMRRWVGDDRPIVIHRHYVRPTPPVCEVVELVPESVDGAVDRLRSRVAVVDGWDWEDPLQPAFQVGPWCQGCEYRVTCESYRG